MADLIVNASGDFKSLTDGLKDTSKEAKAATGYIEGMKAELKAVGVQLNKASREDLPAIRAQFLNLKNSIREAQYGTETFTSKIGGSFEQALQKASKSLFGMDKILKGVLGAFGIGAIVGSFVQATGAADLLENSIKRVVQGLKDLGKTQVEIDLRTSTLPLLEKAQKLLDSQIPASVQLISDMQAEIEKQQGLLTTSASQRSLGKVSKTFKSKEGDVEILTDREGVIAPRDEEKIRSRIGLLSQYVEQLQKVDEKTRSVTDSTSDFLQPADILKDVVNEPDWVFQEHLNEMMQDEAMNPAPGSGFGLQDRLRTQNNKKWIEDYFRMQEEAIDHQERLQEQADQKRLQMIDRAGSRIAQTAEDALSAGLRGGFQDFLQSYLQQTGLKIFSGLIRLGFSAATGGSFGVGGLLGHIFGFAGGGEFYTKGPMPIMVGDNPGGIEKVTVEPISGRGTSGLKNGNLALAGGGTVMSSPMMGNSGSPINVTLMLDKHELGRAWFEPNGVLESINRSRGNPE